MSEKTLKLIDNDRLIILVVSSLKNSMQGKVQVSHTNFSQKFL